MDIIKQLEMLGYKTVDTDFYSHIDTWNSWYKGEVEHFHKYRIWNGRNHISCHRYGLGMGKKVCEDWASLLLNEKVHITLDGAKEQAFFDKVLADNNFAEKGNELQELKAALGTAAYVHRCTGVNVGADGRVFGADAVKIDYVTADKIFPLAWENGEISECAFASEIVADDKKYMYMQIHHRNAAGEYDIDNYLYSCDNGFPQPAPLHSIPGNIPETVHTKSAEKQFVIDRMNIANNIDVSSPMGISVFANAIDQLKGVDVAYDSYVNEFVLGKKRIMVKPEATQDFDGNPFFDPNDVAFYVLPEDSKSGSSVDEISMSLRSSEHSIGIQDMLNMLATKCGLGEKYYKFDNGTVSTATQIISENSSLYRNIKKHEITLEKAIRELVSVILRMGNDYMQAGLDEAVKVSIDFDDSIIEDQETAFLRDSRMLQLGVMNRWEFRAKWKNESEETAKAAISEINKLSSKNT